MKGAMAVGPVIAALDTAIRRPLQMKS